MDDVMTMGIPLDGIAHIIQVALTPVFLLAGICALLDVITARLARVADQFDSGCALLRAAAAEDAATLRPALVRLRRRLHALDAARAFGAVAGAATCVATFTLFLGALQNVVVATVLVLSFGGAVLCTLAALIGYLAEVALAARRRLPDLSQAGLAPD